MLPLPMPGNCSEQLRLDKLRNVIILVSYCKFTPDIVRALYQGVRMPIFEFKCSKCEEFFELLLMGEDKQVIAERLRSLGYVG